MGGGSGAVLSLSKNGTRPSAHPPPCMFIPADLSHALTCAGSFKGRVCEPTASISWRSVHRARFPAFCRDPGRWPGLSPRSSQRTQRRRRPLEGGGGHGLEGGEIPTTADRTAGLQGRRHRDPGGLADGAASGRFPGGGMRSVFSEFRGRHTWDSAGTSELSRQRFSSFLVQAF